ncbi:outer membrane protein assembly factor BamB family protein [Halolamina sediminis]|uniref:outer membrane protein assembly factor BamB family protein n=1 Tax=Halolamina sediminis TaxID=1480675 RepID=UPI0006B43F36|nr:PQQ-binding-like beta-propeller repeat protein [Halolamina sediminis]
MPPHSRRALLASLGTAAVAGCLDGGETPTASTPPDGTATGTTTDSPTPEPPDSVDSTWRMPGCDPGFSNATDAAGPTTAVGELWRFADDAALSAPTVAFGSVYVGTADGDVVALDARSSEERWRRSIGESAFTPRIVSETLYVPTDAGIVALGAEGTEQRRIDTPGRDDSTDDSALPPRVSVLATGDSLYWIQLDDAGETPTVVADALDDGSERWRTEVAEPWTRRLFASHDTVFVPSGTEGQRAWRLSAADGKRLTEPDPGYDFPAERLYRDGTVFSTEPFFGGASAAAVGEDGHSWDTGVPPGMHHVSAGPDRLYVGVSSGDEPGLYALSTTDGSEAWDVSVTPTARPVVASESVLLHGEDALHCFDPTDGTERWSRPNDGIGTTMAVADDLLFAADGETLRAFRPR